MSEWPDCLIDERLERQVDDPQFQNAGKVHDWRNYIPDIIRDNWHQMSREARLVAMRLADDWAAREDWE